MSKTRIVATVVAMLMLASCSNAGAPTTTTGAVEAGGTPGPTTTEAAPVTSAAGDAATTPSGPYKVSLATLAPSQLLWLHYISESEGFYDELNLEVEAIQLSSSSALVQAVSGNSANFAIAQGGSLIDAVDQGAPIIGVGGIVTKAPMNLVAHSDIQEPAQLEGVRVAAGSVEGGTGVVAKRILDNLGVDISTVTMVAITNSSDRVVALDSAAIEASVLTTPFLFGAIDKGYTDFGGLDEAYLNTPLVMNVDWADENPDAARAFVAAFQRAAAWVKDPANRQAAIDILAERTDTDLDVAERSYDYYIEELDAISADFTIPTDSLETVVMLGYWENGETFDPATFDAAKYYDPSYLP